MCESCWRTNSLFRHAGTEMVLRVTILFKSRPEGFLSSVSCQLLSYHLLETIMHMAVISYRRTDPFHTLRGWNRKQKAQLHAMITDNAHTFIALAALHSTVVICFHMSPNSAFRNIALPCLYVLSNNIDCEYCDQHHSATYVCNGDVLLQPWRHNAVFLSACCRLHLCVSGIKRNRVYPSEFKCIKFVPNSYLHSVWWQHYLMARLLYFRTHAKTKISTKLGNCKIH